MQGRLVLALKPSNVISINDNAIIIKLVRSNKGRADIMIISDKEKFHIKLISGTSQDLSYTYDNQDKEAEG